MSRTIGHDYPYGKGTGIMFAISYKVICPDGCSFSDPATAWEYARFLDDDSTNDHATCDLPHVVQVTITERQ